MGLSSGTAGWIAIGAAVAAAIVAVLVLLVWLEGRRAPAPRLRPRLCEGARPGQGRGRPLARGATGGRARHGALTRGKPGFPHEPPRWSRARPAGGSARRSRAAPIGHSEGRLSGSFPVVVRA